MKRKLKNILHLLLAVFSCALYRFPARKLTVIGVTGTSGKTTVVHLLYHILTESGKKTSMISTVQAIINGKKLDTGLHVTTPSPWIIQKYLSEAARGGSKFIILEATSHALDQYRLFGTNIQIAVVTNITHEHLDYHKTYRNYLSAKAKLFHRARVSIINKDDRSYPDLLRLANGKIYTYSLKSEADFQRKDVRETKNKSLPGEFNRYNILASIAVAKLCKVEDNCIYHAVDMFGIIPGRMEEVKSDKAFRIFIDFAHKPDALEAVLTTVREITPGKLIVLFGCAGERDRLKRPMMGEIAARLADVTILTAEDPRSEDVRSIIGQIAEGSEKGGSTEVNKNYNFHQHAKTANKIHIRIPDRQEAINFAIRRIAGKGDVVLCCGKGHEKSMCYGKKEFYWDEKLSVEKALYGKVSSV